MKISSWLLGSMIAIVTFVDAYVNTTVTRVGLYSIILMVALLNGTAYQLRFGRLKSGGAIFYWLLLYAVSLAVLSDFGDPKELAEAMQLLFLPILFLLLVNSTPGQVRFVFWGVIVGKVLYALFVLGGKASAAYPVHELYVPGLLLVVGVLAKRWLYGEEGWRLNAKRFLPFFAIAMGVLFMFSSRGDLICFVAMIAFLVLYKSKVLRVCMFWLPVLIPLTIGFTVYLMQPTQLPQSLAQPTTWTIGQRANLWGTSVSMAQENFPVGVGYKQFNENYRDYWLPQEKLVKFAWDLEHVESPHSQILLTMAEGGFLAAVALMGIFRLAFAYVQDPFARLAQGLVVSIWMSFSTDWFYGSTLIVVIVCLAVVANSQAMHRKQMLLKRAGEAACESHM